MSFHLHFIKKQWPGIVHPAILQLNPRFFKTSNNLELHR